MKAAFCSFPTSPAPGRREGTRPSYIISTSGTAFRPSVLWRSPRNDGDWPCTSSVALAISPAWMSERSSPTCSSIFAGQWSCCGIEAPSTGGKKLNNSCAPIQDFGWKTSPPMPRNSTPQNMCGLRLTAPSRTVHQRTLRSLEGDSKPRCGGSGDPNSSCGPVSMLPISHGHGEYSIIYANLNNRHNQRLS